MFNHNYGRAEIINQICEMAGLFEHADNPNSAQTRLNAVKRHQMAEQFATIVENYTSLNKLKDNHPTSMISVMNTHCVDGVNVRERVCDYIQKTYANAHGANSDFHKCSLCNNSYPNQCMSTVDCTFNLTADVPTIRSCALCPFCMFIATMNKKTSYQVYLYWMHDLGECVSCNMGFPSKGHTMACMTSKLTDAIATNYANVPRIERRACVHGQSVDTEWVVVHPTVPFPDLKQLAPTCASTPTNISSLYNVVDESATKKMKNKSLYRFYQTYPDKDYVPFQQMRQEYEERMKQERETSKIVDVVTPLIKLSQQCSVETMEFKWKMWEKELLEAIGNNQKDNDSRNTIQLATRVVNDVDTLNTELNEIRKRQQLRNVEMQALLLEMKAQLLTLIAKTVKHETTIATYKSVHVVLACCIWVTMFAMLC